MTPSLAVRDPVLLAFATEVGETEPIAVRGGGTRWSLGGDLETGARVIGAPAGLVQFVAEEMTVTVRAGTQVSDLHAELEASGQRTALPERSGGTVGGAICVGESSIHRLGRGHVRNALLQARYVSAEGRLITCGGPTVKNVTGFDLGRVLVGSLGTLGLLAEVILRTMPLPSAACWLTASGADPARARVPTASSILWDGSTTWVHLEGHPDDVSADTAALVEFSPTDDAPHLPRHRFHLDPGRLACTTLPANCLAEIGVGTVHADMPAEPQPLEPRIAELNRRIKKQFDPTGRLNPGRDQMKA